MIRKEISKVPAFTAGDATLIREVLHPKNEEVSLSYSLAYATLEAGTASLPHRLTESSETYVVLEGEGTAFVDGTEVMLEAGTVLYIPAGAEQFVRNEGATTLRFLCIVDPPWRAGAEEVDTPEKV